MVPPEEDDLPECVAGAEGAPPAGVVEDVAPEAEVVPADEAATLGWAPDSPPTVAVPPSVSGCVEEPEAALDGGDLATPAGNGCAVGGHGTAIASLELVATVGARLGGVCEGSFAIAPSDRPAPSPIAVTASAPTPLKILIVLIAKKPNSTRLDV
jgi:hypothetical protein